MDIYLQHVRGSGTPSLGAEGMPLSTASGHEHFPALASDSQGGVIVAWIDEGWRDERLRGVRVKRIRSDYSTVWDVEACDGCRATAPTIVSDGQSGAIVAWSGGGMRAQKLSGSDGDRLWGAGVVISDQASTRPIMVSDKLSGAIVAWSENYKIDVRHLRSIDGRQNGSVLQVGGDPVLVAPAENMVIVVSSGDRDIRAQCVRWP